MLNDGTDTGPHPELFLDFPESFILNIKSSTASQLSAVSKTFKTEKGNPFILLRDNSWCQAKAAFPALSDNAGRA